MNKRMIQSLMILLLLLAMIKVSDVKGGKSESNYADGHVTAGVVNSFSSVCDASIVAEENYIVSEETPQEETEELTVEDSDLYFQYQKIGYSDEDFYGDLELLALITYAEAGNQSEMGKRLVIDTVLNRIDSPVWRDDDTILEAVSHPGQYTTWSSGVYLRYELDAEIVELIEQELLTRTNNDVIFFKTDGYFSGCPELIHEGDHYFSGNYPQY